MASAARARDRHDPHARQRPAAQACAHARPGRQGRPPLKGAKLPTLAEIANTATFQAVTVTGPDGRSRTEHVHEHVCLWYTPFHALTVKVILVRNPGTSEGFDVAIASTDVDVQAAELLARYDSRWTIETANQEARAHGVGEARNRVRRAVERTVPFGFLCQTITIAWYQLHDAAVSHWTPSPKIRVTSTRPPSATPTCSPRFAAN